MRWNAAIVIALAGCSQAPEAERDKPEATGPLRFERVSGDPAEHGERLSAVLGCIGCHDLDLTGNDWSDELGTLWTANLTHSAQEFSHDELLAMITQGKRPDRHLLGMPSYLFTHLHPSDTDALIAYLQTLEPKGEVHPQPTISPELERQMDAGEMLDAPGDVARMRGVGPPDLGPDFAFGRFILRATCVDCHGIDLTGGKRAMEAGGNPPPDLRIVASYSKEDFARFMATGEAAGGRELPLMSAVARRRYSKFTDAERDAVHAYLAELALREP